jgi:hypothetical protein
VVMVSYHKMAIMKKDTNWGNLTTHLSFQTFFLTTLSYPIG